MKKAALVTVTILGISALAQGSLADAKADACTQADPNLQGSECAQTEASDDILGSIISFLQGLVA